MRSISKKNMLSAAIIAASFLLFFSCVSTTQSDRPQSEEKTEQSNAEAEKKSETENKTDKAENPAAERKRVAEIPKIVFSGGIQRIEIEDMFTENFSFIRNDEYSGTFAGKLNNSVSVAKAFVQCPAGSYEILAREKATDSDHAAFYIFVDNEPYRVSPSEPPLGSFENTTRTPVTFTLEADTEVLITVQANSPHHPGQTGMVIDYLQIRKLP